VYVALTVRKLKPGSYDDWWKAWDSGEDEWPEGAQSAYIVRSLKDPDEVIAFGFFDGDLQAVMNDPSFREAEQKRQEAMAPYIESVGADGLYEVIDEIKPPG
jgi:hypothetical protein